MSHLKPISSKTLKKYLAATTRAVEKEIAKRSLQFLVSSPLDEADLTTALHCAYIRNILAIFGQSEQSLKFFVGDNCATNQLTAILLGVPLVGCASHRFNLATKIVLAEHEDLVGAVSALMVALRTIKNCADLRHHTSLAPLRANATRWSPTLMMLERYVRIRDEIKRVDAVYNLVPKSAAHRCIVALVESLKTFNSVCKKLQKDSISMKAVRLLFDKMVEIFPVTGDYLRTDAVIVHSPVFENAVVKMNPNLSGISSASARSTIRINRTTFSRNVGALMRADLVFL
ncbi:hypothetical protein PC120_g22065 [Phytophthora cactorum]|nr:hypothetical protein PC120_g22065 [Phytophthora cactorum]